MHKSDLQHLKKRLQDKLEAIYQLRRTKTKVNWDQAGYLTLLKKFGNPHLRLPPAIHVAGTNGKGSIVAFLRSILEAQGLRVHAYTSPHLMQVNERIVLAGAHIDDVRLEALIDQAMTYNDDAPLSFFEIMTAVAFKAFSDVPADVLLLEVGMGGRLDCTNVITDPLVTIVNRVSMDHVDFLGDDITSIAREKAGIMKTDVPCVVGCQGENYPVYDVLEQEAQRIGAPLLMYGRDWSVQPADDGFSFRFGDGSYDFPAPSLGGAHQLYNAGAALAALFSVRHQLRIDELTLYDGLRNVSWPGRLQELSPVALKMPDDCDVWLDCGHNDSAGASLAVQLAVWQQKDAKPVHLILGMLKTKDTMAFLRPILPYVEKVSVVPVSDDFDGSVSAGDVVFDGPVVAFDCLADVFSSVTVGRVLIAGSVYLAGDVLKMHNFCV